MSRRRFYRTFHRNPCRLRGRAEGAGSPPSSRTAPRLAPDGASRPILRAMQRTWHAGFAASCTASCTAFLAASFVAAAAWSPQVGAQQMGAQQADAEQQRHYSIPAGPLNSALNQFAEEAGLLLSAPGALTAGKFSPGLTGSHDIDAGFAGLLAGTGLEVFQQTDGGYALRPKPETSHRMNDMVTLPTIVVAARPERGATTEGTGSYTATGPSTAATGLGLSLRETPQSISVITQQRIRDQQMSTLDDVLRGTPGISVKFSDRGRAYYAARGFNVTAFQIDGFTMSSGMWLLRTDIGTIYDRAEIVRGATGLLTGAGEPGASVNLVRKRADSRIFTGSASVQLGSWNHRQATIDLSMPLNEDGSVRGRIAASHAAADAFIDMEHTRRSALYGVVEADLTARTRLSAGFSLEKQRQTGMYWGGLPFFHTDGTRTNFPRSTTTATRWGHWNDDSQALFGTLEHAFDNGWKVRTQLNHYRPREDQEMLWVTGDIDRETGTGMKGKPIYYVGRPRQTQLNVAVSGPFQFGGRTHELVAGVTYGRESNGGWQTRTVLNEDDYANGIGSLYGWDGSFGPPVWGASSFSPTTTTESAVYAAARLQLTDPLKLIIGARLSRWEKKTPDTDYLQKESAVPTPYVGVLYDLNEQLTAYASYTSIFQPQNSRDRQGDYLAPLKGNGYEAGLKGEFMEGRLNASLAVFRIQQDNFAETDTGFTVPGTAVPAMRAVKGVTAQGYELEASGALTPNWDFGLGWTQFSARDSKGQNVAVSHSRRMLKLFTRYAFPGDWNRLSVGGGLSWLSDSLQTRANPATGAQERVGQPAFGVVDLMARYDISKALSAQLNIGNLSDKKYYTDTWSTFTYGEPRRVLLTLYYRF